MLPRHERRRAGEDAVAEVPVCRLLVAAVSEVARADGDVRLAVEHGRDQRREMRSVVLAVPVEAHGELEVVFQCVAKGGLHRAADAEVVRQREHARALLLGHLGRAITGAVVHDDDLEAGIEGADLVDHARHAALLVVGGNDGDAP